MYTQVARNKRNSVFLIITFLIVTTLIGWVFARALDSPLILFGAAGLAIFYTWVSYYNSDKMVLAASNARVANKQTYPELYRIVENLTITAGLPMPRVYVIEDFAPNAFATGRDPQHAVICVTTGILHKLEKAELEGVIAHELSHIGNYDIRIMSLVAVMVAIIALLSDLFWHFGGFFGSDDDRDRGGSQAQVIFLLIAIVLAVVAPIIGTIIQLAVSRKREYLADASGALLTRYPQGLAQALQKIDADTEPLEAANKATANLYIINPLREGRKGHGAKSFMANLFSTHPSTADRIKRLKEMEIKA